MPGIINPCLLRPWTLDESLLLLLPHTRIMSNCNLKMVPNTYRQPLIKETYFVAEPITESYNLSKQRRTDGEEYSPRWYVYNENATLKGPGNVEEESRRGIERARGPGHLLKGVCYMTGKWNPANVSNTAIWTVPERELQHSPLGEELMAINVDERKRIRLLQGQTQIGYPAPRGQS